MEVDLLNLSNEQIEQYVFTPAADPYLTWAALTGFRGYEPNVRGDGSQYLSPVVSAESIGGYKLPGGADSTTEIYAGITDDTGHVAVYTGLLDDAALQSLLGGECINKEVNHAPCLRMELNLARINDGTVQAGSIEQFPESPVLGNTVIAIIDHGCPFAHPQFRVQSPARGQRGEKWETRVKLLWDQDRTKTVRVPIDDNLDVRRDRGFWWFGVKGFGYGRQMTQGVLNALIQKHYQPATGRIDETAIYREANYETLEDRFTHGAGVMDLATGHINPTTGHADAASNADIIFVQLPRDAVADTSGGSMTHHVLDALKFIFDRTKNVKHLAINLSFGSTAGPHDGTSLLERTMDMLIQQAKSAVKDRKVELFLPAGNHYLSQCHGFAEVSLAKSAVMPWVLMPDDRTDNFLELWCARDKDIRVRLVSPTGIASEWSGSLNSVVELFARYGLAVNGAIIRKQDVASGLAQVILLALGPTHREQPRFNRQPGWTSVEHGVWHVEIESSEGSPVTVHGWVERDDAIAAGWRQPQSYLLTERDTPRMHEDDDALSALQFAKIARLRAGTGNSLANGRLPIVVGAEVGNSRRASNYAAAAHTTLKPGRSAWPDWSVPADESESLSGLLVGGTRTGTLVRMNGSSAAAPQIARAYINAWVNGENSPAGAVVSRQRDEPVCNQSSSSTVEPQRLGNRRLNADTRTPQRLQGQVCR